MYFVTLCVRVNSYCSIKSLKLWCPGDYSCNNYVVVSAVKYFSHVTTQTNISVPKYADVFHGEAGESGLDDL